MSRNPFAWARAAAPLTSRQRRRVAQLEAEIGRLQVRAARCFGIPLAGFRARKGGRA